MIEYPDLYCAPPGGVLRELEFIVADAPRLGSVCLRAELDSLLLVTGDKDLPAACLLVRAEEILCIEVEIG